MSVVLPHARVAAVALMAIVGAVHGAAGETLRGTVLDRTGAPAAGASVWAVGRRVAGPSERREATADDRGQFAMEMGPGPWTVWARRGDEGGRLLRIGAPEISGGEDPVTFEIHLSAPSRLRGRLLDAATGRPIMAGQIMLDDTRAVAVDAEGRFVAPALPSGLHDAWPVCPGYERRQVIFTMSERPETELEVTVPRGGRAAGRIVDEQGTPIAGAYVAAGDSLAVLPQLANTERCDDHGRFHWDGLAIGRTIRLGARAEGYAEHQQELFLIEGEWAPELTFTLVREAPKAGAVAARSEGKRDVFGTVVSFDGRPVAGAVVRWSRGARRQKTTTTDQNGRFRLAQVPDEGDTLVAMARGLAPAVANIDAGGDREVKLELAKGVTIRGRVRDESGRPVPGVRVLAVGRGVGVGTSRTNADGQFVLEHMPDPTGGVRLLDESGRFVQLSDLLTVTQDAQNELTITAVGAIRGRVRSPLGKPVRNFRVFIDPSLAQRGGPVQAFSIARTGMSVTSDDGTFVASGLKPGAPYRVIAWADGYGLADQQPIIARPASALGDADVVTLDLGLPHTLRVRTVEAGGRPITRAAVSVIRSDAPKPPTSFLWGNSDSHWEELITGHPNAEGWTEFPALSFPRATVIVRARGYGRLFAPWSSDAEELTLVLEPEARVAGHVRDAAGQVVADAGVRVVKPGEGLEVPVDPITGRFAVSELAPGAYGLVARRRAGGGAPFDEDVTLEAGKALEREIQLPKAAKRP